MVRIETSRELQVNLMGRELLTALLNPAWVEKEVIRKDSEEFLRGAAGLLCDLSSPPPPPRFWYPLPSKSSFL